MQSKSKGPGYLLVSILSVLLFTAACSSHPKGPPGDGIMKSDRLVDLLVDIHYADGVYNESFDVIGYIKNPEYDTLDFYTRIFEKYDTDEEAFRKTIQYYSYNPYQFEVIYDRVMDKMNKMMMQALEEKELMNSPPTGAGAGPR